MYAMPGEVLQGEKPGPLGLSLYQMFAGMIGFLLASGLNLDVLVDNDLLALCIYVLVALGGIVLARRSRGLYLIEQVFYVLRFQAMMYLEKDEAQGVLDPATLYRGGKQERQRAAASTYVVRRPDGATMMVRE